MRHQGYSDKQKCQNVNVELEVTLCCLFNVSVCKDFIFNFNYVYVCGWFLQISPGAYRVWQRTEVSDALELESWTVVMCQTWVLGTELRFWMKSECY